MSFSTLIKDEITSQKITSNCCKIVFIKTSIITLLRKNLEDKNITFVNVRYARYFVQMLKEIYHNLPESIINIKKRFKKNHIYDIKISEEIFDDLKIKDSESLNDIYLGNDCCKKNFLKNLFISFGYVSNPANNYHLELGFHLEEWSDYVKDLISSFGINSKTTERFNKYSVYIKESESIVDFINLIGAHKSLLDMENLRIIKQMRSDVNRIVNCETSNIERVVKAASKQIENIYFIEENFGINSLPDSLKEVALLRLKHKSANLQELAELFSGSLTKSGINHRLKKIDKIANHLKSRRVDNDD